PTREGGDAPNAAVSLCNLGELATYEADFEDAARLAGEGLEIGRAHRLSAVVAGASYLLGNVAVATAQYERARTYYVESLETARGADSKDQVASALDGFARLAAA